MHQAWFVENIHEQHEADAETSAIPEYLLLQAFGHIAGRGAARPWA
jgi:hypothetical protein